MVNSGRDSVWPCTINETRSLDMSCVTVCVVQAQSRPTNVLSTGPINQSINAQRYRIAFACVVAMRMETKRGALLIGSLLSLIGSSAKPVDNLTTMQCRWLRLNSANDRYNRLYKLNKYNAHSELLGIASVSLVGFAICIVPLACLCNEAARCSTN
jgi:hypothetical protein